MAHSAPNVLASLALAMTLIAFILGSAAFTPALALAVIALPMAIACMFFGVFRVSAVAVFFASAALLVVPASRILRIQVDVMLVILGIVGIVSAAVLYANYLRSRQAG